MKTYSIKFRNFDNVSACFSYYSNGNICLEIYTGDVFLCELSKDMGYNISSNAIILRDTIHTDIFINELMCAGLITAFQYHKSISENIYICNLSHKVVSDMQRVDTRIPVAATV